MSTITQPVRLTQPEHRLIALKSIYEAASAIVSIFLGLYLFRIGGFPTLAIYYVADFSFLSVGFVLFGYLLRRFTSRALMRTGLVFLCGVYLMLVVTGENARHIVVLFGALAGIGQGLYWPGINVNEYFVTHERTRHLYLAGFCFWSSLATTSAPLIAGVIFVVTTALSSPNTGYYVLFGVLVVTLLVARRQVPGTGAPQRMYFSIFQVFAGPREPKWRLVLAQQFLLGAWTSCLTALAPVLLYLVLHHEMNVTMVSAVSTLLGGTVAVYGARLLQRHHQAYVIGAVGIAIGIVGFASQPNWLGVVCFVALVKGTEAMSTNPATKASYDSIGRGDGRHSFHLFVETEIVLNAGRVLAFAAILLMLGSHDQADAVRRTIAVGALVPLAIGYLQHRIGRPVLQGSHSCNSS